VRKGQATEYQRGGDVTMAKARIVRGVALVGLGVLTAFAVGRAAGPYLTPPSMVFAADPDPGGGGGGSGPSADKIVPILSVGRGIEIGAAQVRGPADRVHEVQAVAELEAKFKDFLVLAIYVPISTKIPGEHLSRVQGVGVYALAGVKLTGN
jgi:hypothetical protein